MRQDGNLQPANREPAAAIAAFQAAPSRETEERLCAALGSMQFFLPLCGGGAEGNQAPGADLSVLHARDGTVLPFAFTEEQAFHRFLRQADAESPAAVFSFSQLADLILHAQPRYCGILINPGSQHPYLLSRESLAAYSGSALPVTLAEQTELILGQPNEFPEALGAALCAAAALLPALRHLWLLLKLDCGTGERSFLIVLDHHGGNLQSICDALGRAASAALPYGAAAEFLPRSATLARTALRQHPALRPFYSRLD